KIRALPDRLAPRGRRAHFLRCTHPAFERCARFRVLHVARDAVDELLEYVRSADAQIAAAAIVAVQIRNCMLAQIRRVRLRPFRGAEDGRLLAVPRCVDDRALWTPSLLPECAERSHLFELRDETRDRI